MFPYEPYIRINFLCTLRYGIFEGSSRKYSFSFFHLANLSTVTGYCLHSSHARALFTCIFFLNAYSLF